jgi:hypothetical protein
LKCLVPIPNCVQYSSTNVDECEECAVGYFPSVLADRCCLQSCLVSFEVDYLQSIQSPIVWFMQTPLNAIHASQDTLFPMISNAVCSYRTFNDE